MQITRVGEACTRSFAPDAGPRVGDVSKSDSAASFGSTIVCMPPNESSNKEAVLSRRFNERVRTALGSALR